MEVEANCKELQPDIVDISLVFFKLKNQIEIKTKFILCSYQIYGLLVK